MDFPFHGMPTVPPRKDMDHLAFFCGGCRCASVCVWVGVGVGGAGRAGGGIDGERSSPPEGGEGAQERL